MQQQHRTTSNGSIDYDHYKTEAKRLRMEARRRTFCWIGGLPVRLFLLPLRLCWLFANSWQSTWPAPAVLRRRARRSK
jgi:hypothetical protein